MLQNLNSQSPTVVSDELKPISFESLEKMKTSLGDLYWKKGNGKLVKLLHSGDRLDFSKLEKFQKVTKFLYMIDVCDEEFIASGKRFLQKLVDATSERERLLFRHQFLDFISDIYWRGDSDGSILNLITIFKDVFYKISPEFESEMEERALSILRRSSLYSTLVTLTALCSGYTHGDFLTDVYNISFFNDFSCARGLSTHDDSVHVKKSLEEFEHSTFYKLKHKSLSRLITFHHEDFRGRGKSIGLIFDELNKLERISIFIEQSLTYEESGFNSNDGKKFISDLFEIKDEDSFQLKRFKNEIREEFVEFSQKEVKAS
ncbi:hypothetical protein [Halobacteriovorax sp.]|uniref:hypothetical protein n=1 Tax=Halobacteriovorax sp. TaxID=2020862 RepID=UPI0035629B09